MQNKNDEKPVDESDAEKSECPYKNGQNSGDNDTEGSTKLEEAVKEAEEATTLSQENTTGLDFYKTNLNNYFTLLGLQGVLNCLFECIFITRLIKFHRCR